jgi:hypothetical protein
MKFKTRREHYTAEHTVDGITVPITRSREVTVPVLPRDWDRTALRTTTGLVLALTVVAVTWSTVSIGSVLGGGVGYIAATVFDLAWAICLLLEWMARFSPKKRTFPRRLGWVLLALTMGAIFWNGMLSHSIAMAIVGAVVSFVAKALWLGVTKHIDRDLSDADQQWAEAQTSAAHAKEAVAQVRRQAARIEHQAAAELLAMEAAYGLSVASATPSAATAAPSVASAAPAATQSATPAPALAPAGPVPLDAGQLAALLAALGATQQQAAPVASATDLDDMDDAEMEEDDAEALEPPTLASLSKADAVRIALRKRPGYNARQVTNLLAGYGVAVTDSYVRQVKARDAEQASELVSLVPIRKAE